MARAYTYEGLAFLYGIFLVNTSVFIRKFSCSSAYIVDNLIVYFMQKTKYKRTMFA